MQWSDSLDALLKVFQGWFHTLHLKYSKWIESWTWINHFSLTHCDLLMPYGIIEHGQHWFRWWLIAWTRIITEVLWHPPRFQFTGNTGSQDIYPWYELAASHYPLNQCYLLFGKARQYSAENKFTAGVQATVPHNEFENYTFEIIDTSPRANELSNSRALSYYSDQMLSQSFQQMAAQLSKKAALPLAKILVTWQATLSCCSSKTGSRSSTRLLTWPAMRKWHTWSTRKNTFRDSFCATALGSQDSIWPPASDNTLWASGNFLLISNSCGVKKSDIPLIHCGLVTPYGDRDLGQHWLR